MSFCIIKGDLLEQNVDAIVVPSTISFKLEGAIGGKVAQICGERLQQEISQLKIIDFNQCAIINSYNLPCKRIILTANPKWFDGHSMEESNLADSYENCIKLANKMGIKSIAFPILSIGEYAFPKKKGITVALDSLSYLGDKYDIQIELVVYTSKIFNEYKELFVDFAVIGEKYGNTPIDDFVSEHKRNQWYKKSMSNYDDEDQTEFVKVLKGLIDKKDLTHEQVYKHVISNTMFNNILNGAEPNKYTIVSLGIKMGLDISDINQLLHPVHERLDYYLGQDEIIIKMYENWWNSEHKIPTHELIIEINNVLSKHHYPTLPYRTERAH